MKIEINLWQVATVILAIVLVISIFRPWETKISERKAVEIGEKIISSYLEASGYKAEVLKGEAKDAGSFYNVSLTLLVGNQSLPATLYISKDGKYWATNLVNINELFELLEKEKQEFNPEIPKSETPKVDLYIMAFCPFGTKAIKTMIPVYKLLNQSVDFNVHYVIYENYRGEGFCIENNTICSMHGLDELREDMRQLCIAKEYGKDTLWQYFDAFYNCGATDECREQAFEKLGINVSKIEECMNSSWVIDKLYEEKELNKKYGVSASPTLFINGVMTNVVYNYGNSEAYKETICDAFTQAPAECDITLSNESMGYGGVC